jgi:hypothetical protein
MASPAETPATPPARPRLSPPGTIHDDDDSADLFRLLGARPFIEPDDY